MKKVQNILFLQLLLLSLFSFNSSAQKLTDENTYLINEYFKLNKESTSVSYNFNKSGLNNRLQTNEVSLNQIGNNNEIDINQITISADTGRFIHDLLLCYGMIENKTNPEGKNLRHK